MQIEQTDTGVRVSGSGYVLQEIEPGVVRLSGRSASGELLAYADLKVVSGVHQCGASDVIRDVEGPVVAQDGPTARLVWTSGSSVWESKKYVFTCRDEYLSYHVEVSGSGRISYTGFFEGIEGQPSSLYRFTEMMSSEVSMLDRRFYKPMEYACIDATSGQTSERPREPEDNNHWLFTPPPFVFAWTCFRECWMAAGVAAEPGESNFTFFQHWPVHNCFSLRLTYDGMTAVEGTWKSPTILLEPADDEYDCVRRYCNRLREIGCAPRVDRRPPPGLPLAGGGNEPPPGLPLAGGGDEPPPGLPMAGGGVSWWSFPMFCGWGQQNMTAVDRGGGGNSWARQDAYDEFLGLLAERGIDPGTIVIDDKWQKQYGTLEVDTEKWPDLRGWIDARHDESRHVLLWIGCWSQEGLDPGMCITRGGDIICADPSSGSYEKMLREAVRRMLADEPGCYNADGFKVDWTNGLPSGEGFETHGDIWGIELLKRLYWIIYDEAKRVKPDSLIVTHAANPYFSDVTDMIRLNDISALQRDMAEIMRHRQKLALAVDSGWLIDCDNSSAPTVDEWLRYMKVQPELGVPSLYFITGVDGTGEPIPREHWDQVPDLWRNSNWRKNL